MKKQAHVLRSKPGGRAGLLPLALALFFAAVVGVIAAAARGADLSWVAHIPGQDFTGHLAIFGTLAFLWHGVAVQQRGGSPVDSERPPWHPRAWPASCVVLGLLVLAEELSQLGLAHRTFSVSDLVADAFGLWLGFTVSAILWRE